MRKLYAHTAIETIMQETEVGLFAIHQFTAKADFYANAQIIETPHSLVIYDAHQSFFYGKQLYRYCQSLGKPIERVIIGHAHIDHYAGLPAFEGIPIYASASVIEDFHRQHIEKAYIPQHPLPDQWTLDGISFEVMDIPEAHCPHHSVLWIPELATCIAGDLAQFRGHLLAYDFDAFVEGLDKMRKHKEGYQYLFTGHGLPTKIKILDENYEYMKTCRDISERVSSLKELDQQIKATFPDRSKILAPMGILLKEGHRLSSISS